MGSVHAELSPEHIAFIARQRLVFVASAPLSGDGHVNCSPRGLDTFRVLSPTRVAWLDLTGSGNETAAHLLENGRIVLMFCAFEGPPRILRIHGRGRIALPGSEGWSALRGSFPDIPGARQIIVVDASRVSVSCGHGVPRYAFIDDRQQMIDWAAARGEAGLEEYRQRRNVVSIDGLPAPVAASPASRTAHAQLSGAPAADGGP